MRILAPPQVGKEHLEGKAGPHGLAFFIVDVTGNGIDSGRAGLPRRGEEGDGWVGPSPPLLWGERR